MKKIILVLVWILSAAFSVSAQSIHLYGKVVDEKVLHSLLSMYI